MLNRGRVLRLGAALVIGTAVLGAVACSGGGVSKSDYDKVKQDLQDQQTQNQQLQQQMANAPKTTTGGVSAASGSATPAAGDTMWLLGAKKVPKAPPAPTATPTPPGYVAPPKPVPDAKYYEPQQYFVYVEVLQASRASSFDVQSTLSCVPASQFVRGQRIVWRYDIIDGKTGKRITDKDGAKVKIVLPNGAEASGSFSQRGGGRIPDAPFMWGSNWDIPVDFPLGGIDYKVVITTADGNAFTWVPPALVSADGASDTRPKVYQ